MSYRFKTVLQNLRSEETPNVGNKQKIKVSFYGNCSTMMLFGLEGLLPHAPHSKHTFKKTLKCKQFLDCPSVNELWPSYYHFAMALHASILLVSVSVKIKPSGKRIQSERGVLRSDFTSFVPKIQMAGWAWKSQPQARPNSLRFLSPRVHLHFQGRRHLFPDVYCKLRDKYAKSTEALKRLWNENFSPRLG